MSRMYNGNDSDNTLATQCEIHPFSDTNNIPVVFAANNAFVPVFAACFQSLIDNISSEYNYDVFLIESDITDENKNELLSMTYGVENLSLRFLDASPIVSSYNLTANGHITQETYYRFIIQHFLCNFSKVLYLDCDLIINSDISELFDTDITGYMLAAVYDIEFSGNINGASKAVKEYSDNVLKMKNPENYFQAGVLLLNMGEMRKAYSIEQWLTFASNDYKYNDQDVLNIYCENRVRYVGMEWNFLTDCNHTRVSDVIIHAREDLQAEYKAVADTAKIIHYAGFMKPWLNPQEDKARFFWKYARKTVFYEELLHMMVKNTIKERKKEKMASGIKGKTIKKFADLLLPAGTRRRDMMKKIIGI